MPSPRRLRLLMLVGLTATVTILFFTSQWQTANGRESHSLNSFYDKTKNAMDQKRGSGGAQIPRGKDNGQIILNDPKDKDGDGTIDDDDTKMAAEMAGRLRAAEQQAKELANAKSPLKPDSPSNIVGIGSSAGGQVKKPKDGESDSSKDGETDEEHEIELILNDIFKKSPGRLTALNAVRIRILTLASLVIIFSKSYCPHSKRAKGILLDKYSIDPPPYVVELDEHPKGKELQARLAELTGRNTVPNIMINGKSIGGADDTAELDARKTLIDKIKSMGGKRVSMKERFVGHSKGRE